MTGVSGSHRPAAQWVRTRFVISPEIGQTVDLDVSSQASADAAIEQILAEAGALTSSCRTPAYVHRVRRAYITASNSLLGQDSPNAQTCMLTPERAAP